ncbi:hypothetical protein BHM03_00024228 [Ensete ventricosum]|nr:hypothetical protein BHM03_00024228 [Ensete ventricosum]
MGLLDQLWDDTVAGPPPLRKLRKYNSFSPSSSSAAAAAAAAGQVSRSITILRTPASSPRSPSSPTSAPDSPFARDSGAERRLEEAAEEVGAGGGGNADGRVQEPHRLRLLTIAKAFPSCVRFKKVRSGTMARRGRG